MEDKTICVFGDSVACGYYDYEKRGWVARLDEYINSKEWENDIYNLSINGDDTNRLIQRFESEAKYREPEVIIIAEGTNDAQLQNGEEYITVEEFSKNLDFLIEKSKKITKDIIFISNTKVDELKTSPVPWLPEKKISYENDRIKQFNDVIEAKCKEHNCKFLDVFDLLNNDDLPDGIHLSSRGHEKMFQRIRNFLIENKIIEKF